MPLYDLHCRDIRHRLLMSFGGCPWRRREELMELMAIWMPCQLKNVMTVVVGL